MYKHISKISVQINIKNSWSILRIHIQYHVSVERTTHKYIDQIETFWFPNVIEKISNIEPIKCKYLHKFV